MLSRLKALAGLPEGAEVIDHCLELAGIEVVQAGVPPELVERVGELGVASNFSPYPLGCILRLYVWHVLCPYPFYGLGLAEVLWYL